MKDEIKNLLGFDVKVTGIVETLDEAIEKAGSKEAVLKDYNANVLAHSHYTVARQVIIKKLEELTGIKRNTKKVGEKEVLDEKDAEYVARLETQLGEEAVAAHGAAISAAVAAVPVDYTPGTRGSGGSDAAPAKKWLAFYDQLVTEDKLGRFCSKYGIAQDGDEGALRITVASKVKEIALAKQREAEKAAVEV